MLFRSAGPERSCHAASAWAAPEPVASLARAAGLDRDAVKFAYFFMSPPSQPGPPRPISGLRIVSEPMLNKAGRLRYLACGSGRLSPISARADDPTAASSGFLELRRGDVVNPASLRPRATGGYELAESLELCAVAPETSP